MNSENIETPKLRLMPSAWMVDLIARIAMPVRSKLLIAFIGIALLMIAMALTGVAELRKASVRTAEVVNDNVRIAALSSLSRNIQDAMLAGTALLAGNDNSPHPFVTRLSWMMSDIRGNLDDIVADPQRASEMMLKAQEFQATGTEIVSLYDDGDVSTAKALFDNQLQRGLRNFDREVLKLTFDLRLKMRDQVEVNEVAFQRSRQLLLGASGLAIVLALVLGYLISASITRPIQHIRGALRAVAGGDFKAKARVANRDELGELAKSANSMAEQLGVLYGEVETQRAELAKWNMVLEEKVETQVKEIERTNRLRRFLPAQVADLIVGAPDEADVLRTKRAEITVLFADLRGFTAFATAATPDQVVAALNTFHGACGPLVEASGGTLERFLGDGLMVLFGAPVPMDDAAQRAVELAKQMRVSVGAAMAPFKAGTEDRSLGVGIGIGTGAATLGQIGFEGRRDYSAIGPAPNLAARLSDMAGSGQILISHATAWQVDSEMKPAGPYDLKGIGDSVAAFELVVHSEAL